MVPRLSTTPLAPLTYVPGRPEADMDAALGYIAPANVRDAASIGELEAVHSAVIGDRARAAKDRIAANISIVDDRTRTARDRNAAGYGAEVGHGRRSPRHHDSGIDVV